MTTDKDKEPNFLQIKRKPEVHLINNEEINIYRDTPIRLLGYANELAEAFRPLIPRLVYHIGYIIATSYVVADCVDNTYKMLMKPKSLGGGLKPALIEGGDIFIWQMFASVAIPGYLINRVTWGTEALLKKSQAKGLLRKWGPSMAGLIVIPFIIHPIDHACTVGMDKTYRKIFPRD